MVVITAQLVVLGALIAGTAAFVTKDKTVTVSVDGHVQKVRTFSGDVHGVLDQAHVQVGSHDLVSPGLDARVHDDSTIVVRRGRELTLTVGEQTRQVWVTASTVDEALDQLGLDRQGMFVSASRSRTIGLEGAAMVVRLPQHLSVVVDGRRLPIVTTAPTVGQMLVGNHIALGKLDRLSVPADAYPTDGMVVGITRISTQAQVDSDVIAHAVRRIADGALYKGHSRTVDPGQDGIIRRVFGLVYKDGVLVKRTLVSEQVTRPMRPAVVAYGTKPVPAPPASTYSSGGGLNWTALARCESGGNPRAVSSGGTYRGLYQFSMSTWRGVGGSGDPIDASAAEQTHRAQILYARSGRGAWPVCGQYL
ncbi:MAG TPA: ubiquitin-like domain-containing protein [Mycobacteriales bacterium]|nr:ubiquitin-like domain-containing protein [Mycobacteriales bacterium]